MRLFERHRNGAIIDMTGEANNVIPFVIEWRKYQDSKDTPRPPVGFTVETGSPREPDPAFVKEVKEF